MKKYSIEIKWGIIFILATLLWMFLEKQFGLHSEHLDKHATYTNFFSIVAIAIYVLALLDKRKNAFSGTMSWKQGFKAGFIITIVVTVLTPIAQIITHNVISPEYFPNIIEMAVETGLQSREEAEAYFNLNNYILISTIFAFVVGILTSAIVAVFTRKSY
ncbi:DUF4199 domain-containing protein [Peijinzhouia sedimentorum]